MCDTLGILTNGTAFFGKNSDRSPNEPQIAEFHPARKPEEKEFRATYITIPQAEETKSVLLSRPVWMPGAEMGVNECGVCIGNEALFTTGAKKKTGLTGMDLVRLALERSESAKDALETILTLLETYGQGGNCGFDRDFYYDNSFLVMDRNEIYVLETAGKEWAYRKLSKASISNCITIGTDGDRYSGETVDFKKKHTRAIFTYFAGAEQRRAQTQRALNDIHSVKDVMNALRSHENGQNMMCRGSVRSSCMHAGGIGDHTTASWAVELSGDGTINVWLTGGSLPCMSLYKPYRFGNGVFCPVYAADAAEEAEREWIRAETVKREWLGKEIPPEFYTERDMLEDSWLEIAKDTTADGMAKLAQRAVHEELEFIGAFPARRMEDGKTASGFDRYWAKKKALLGKSREEQKR